MRDFVRRHSCTSPYFADISREFLNVIQHDQPSVVGLPEFLPELAQYEWAELALAVAPDPPPVHATDCGLLDGHPVVSPLAWVLSYRYPAHRIGTDFRPTAPSPAPTHLVVFRDHFDDVRFIEVNALTAQLLRLLANRSLTGRAALQALAGEQHPPDATALIDAGSEALTELLRIGILCGATAGAVIE